MRLIDADALLQEAKRLSGPQTGDGWDNWGVYALIERQPTVTPEPGWISVKDRLPQKSDEYMDYIVYIVDDEGNCAIGIAEWDCKLGVGSWRLGPDSVVLPEGMYITHWMNTPEPPKEE